MIVASGGVFIAHAALGYPYPELRTGLYWIPLATLATVALMAEVRRELAITLSLFSIGIVVQYAANFQTSYYLEWRYSAGARPIMERIRSLKPAGTTQPLIVGATWLLEPSLNFYRDIFHLDWFEEILPLGSGGERKSLEETECDFYVLWEDDRSLASKRQLRVLMDDPVSEAMLAIPEPHN